MNDEFKLKIVGVLIDAMEFGKGDQNDALLSLLCLERMRLMESVWPNMKKEPPHKFAFWINHATKHLSNLSS
jgi:hypothetical protein